MRVPPNHSFIDGFSTNHPAMGVPPWLWKPPYVYSIISCKCYNHLPIGIQLGYLELPWFEAPLVQAADNPFTQDGVERMTDSAGLGPAWRKDGAGCTKTKWDGDVTNEHGDMTLPKGVVQSNESCSKFGTHMNNPNLMQKLISWNYLIPWPSFFQNGCSHRCYFLSIM